MRRALWLSSFVACCLLIWEGIPTRATVPLTGAGAGAPGAASCTFPTVTGGVKSRWRADVGVTLSGSNVTAVADQVGATPLANVGVVPWSATGFNSKPAFNFVAANNAGLTVASFPIGTGTQAWVWVVGQMSANTANFGGLVSYGAGGGSDFNQIGSASFINRNSTGTSVITTANTTTPAATNVTTGANHTFLSQYDGTNINLYVDNAGNSPQAYSTAFVTNGILAIGNRVTTGAVTGGAWEGPVSEIVFGVGNISSTDRTNIQTYSTCQWGFP